MAAPVVASTDYDWSVYDSGDETVTKPTGTTSGDLLLAYYNTISPIGHTHDTPSGWTLIGTLSGEAYGLGANTARLSVFRKVAGGSEPSSYTFTNSNGSETYGYAIVVRITGADTSDPIDDFAFDDVGNDDPIAFPGVTTDGIDRLLVIGMGLPNGYAGIGGGDWPNVGPSGFTIHRDVEETVGEDSASFGLASKAQASAASVGPFSVDRTITAEAAGCCLLATIAVKPAGAAGYTLIGEAAASSLSGQAAGLLRGRLAAGEAGAFVLTGQTAGIRVGRLVTGGAAAFALTGNVADLIQAGSGAYTLAADTSAFSFVGQASVLLSVRRLSAASGSHALAGQAAALRYGRKLSSEEAGAFTFAGLGAGLFLGRVLGAAAAPFGLMGQAALFARTRLLSAGTSAFVLTGQAAILNAPDYGIYAPPLAGGELTAPALGPLSISAPALGLTIITAPPL